MPSSIFEAPQSSDYDHGQEPDDRDEFDQLMERLDLPAIGYAAVLIVCVCASLFALWTISGNAAEAFNLRVFNGCMDATGLGSNGFGNYFGCRDYAYDGTWWYTWALCGLNVCPPLALAFLAWDYFTYSTDRGDDSIARETFIIFLLGLSASIMLYLVTKTWWEWSQIDLPALNVYDSFPLQFEYGFMETSGGLPLISDARQA